MTLSERIPLTHLALWNTLEQVFSLQNSPNPAFLPPARLFWDAVKRKILDLSWIWRQLIHARASSDISLLFLPLCCCLVLTHWSWCSEELTCWLGYINRLLSLHAKLEEKINTTIILLYIRMRDCIAYPNI